MDEASLSVRSFVEFHDCGVLSTLSQSSQGYPFGSVAPYDVTLDGNLVFSFSTLAEHYRNLVADGRASLLVADRFGERDPQRFSRATLIGMCRLTGNEHRGSYERRFPQTPARELAHDFHLFVLTVERIRWIGGFGDIKWVSGDSYRAVSRDPIAYEGRAIVDHLNEDHQSALADLLQARGLGAVRNVRAVAICGTGLVIEWREGDETNREAVSFPGRLSTPVQVRDALKGMLRTARESRAV